MSPAVPVERVRGGAAAFHAREVPPLRGPEIWWFEVERPALVLGSTQPDGAARHAVAADRGVEVVRRRSGGGAVLLRPGATTWVDVSIPRSDPRWVDDVGRSFEWIGRAWAEVLAGLGVEGLRVHTGALRSTRWSSLVCFAGLGPGELTAGSRKVVGIAQRRTRDHARFQCAVLHRWEPEEVAALVDGGPVAAGDLAADLAEVAVGIDELVGRPVAADDLVRSLAHAVAPALG